MTVDHDLLKRLRDFQAEVRSTVPTTARKKLPPTAVGSLREAAAKAPSSYSEYLEEALACYESYLFRAAILLVWSATIRHLYDRVGDHGGGLKEFERQHRLGTTNSKGSRKFRKRDDLMYLRDRTFIELGEKAGLFNKTARELLLKQLDLRNRCGHPTGYQVGQHETAVFMESLCLNILSDKWLNWQPKKVGT